MYLQACQHLVPQDCDCTGMQVMMSHSTENSYLEGSSWTPYRSLWSPSHGATCRRPAAKLLAPRGVLQGDDVHCPWPVDSHASCRLRGSHHPQSALQNALMHKQLWRSFMQQLPATVLQLLFRYPSPLKAVLQAIQRPYTAHEVPRNSRSES